MGEDIPTDPPEYDPVKWYCCFVLAFQDMTPATGCDQTLVGAFTCCIIGAQINAWLLHVTQCVAELCVVTGFTAQLLYDDKGPYDNFGACIGDCP